MLPSSYFLELKPYENYYNGCEIQSSEIMEDEMSNYHELSAFFEHLICVFH